MRGALSIVFIAAALTGNVSAAWKNVFTGASGGWTGGIIFNTKQKGLAFLRTDIGGAYKLNPTTDTWTPLTDWADSSRSDYWGCESIATDPVDPQNLYIEVGLYTNAWDSLNGTILISNNQGLTFKEVKLPFKVGGNMPGRGAGERLVVDPKNNKVLYLGARSGKGLYKSSDAGLTWSKVAGLTAVGSFVTTPGDTSGYNSDPLGIAWIVFDTTSASSSKGTSRIFVGSLETPGSPSVYVSNDYGVTWSAVAGQPTTYLPHHGVFSAAEKSLYVSYVNTAGPFDGGHGALGKYNVTTGQWADITPAQAVTDNGYGFGGLTLDAQKPGVVMAASLNQYYPDAQLWRSLDGGKTWTNIYSYSYPPPDYSILVAPNYVWDVSTAPWIASFVTDTKKIGWGIEGLSIDPFDSNHLLYGTGLSVFGSKDLTKWDASPRQNITIKSLSVGIEETAATGLISPPVGPNLISTVGDIGGWAHTDLDKAPLTLHTPNAGTLNDLDYAGNKPSYIVHVGNLATSTNSGTTWTLYPNTPSGITGGRVTYSANATSIVWNADQGYYVAKSGGAFTSVTGLPAGAIIEADKSNDAYIYATQGGKIFASSNGGTSFAQVNLLGSATDSNDLAVNNLGTAGEFYVAAPNGLWKATNYGKNLIGISGGITSASRVAVGAPASAGGPPTLYVIGVYNGVTGIYRSDNTGGSWTRIDDATHGFTAVTGSILTADPRVQAVSTAYSVVDPVAC